jgi:hypothetical protein
LNIERFSGWRARKGLEHKLFVLMTGVTFGSALACSYDYQVLKGPADGPDGGAGGSRASGGAPGSGGSVIPGSGGRAGTGSGGATASGGTTGTGGAGKGGASGSGGTMATGTGGGPGSGGAASTGGTSGTGGAGGQGGTGVTGGAGGTNTAAGGQGGTGAVPVGGGAASGGASGAGGAGGGYANSDPDLVLWYKFEETSGIAVADSSTAGTPHTGMLATFGTGGDAVFSTMHQVGSRSVALTSQGSTGGGYVILPTLQEVAPAAITLSIWVQPTTAQRWQRVFDLGNTTATNMALTTQDGTDSVRFVIRVADAGPEQLINTTAKLTLSVWHHLVVVLRAGSPYTGEIFIDGVLAGTNPAMTLHAQDLGVTTNNFLGRSQFATDPYWSGLFDDFRVYRRALTAAEVAALMLQR